MERDETNAADVQRCILAMLEAAQREGYNDFTIADAALTLGALQAVEVGWDAEDTGNGVRDEIISFNALKNSLNTEQ